MLPGSLLQAQDSAPVEYAENGTGPVATFTATDPEGAMPITWSVAVNADIDGVESADITDNGLFTIDKDGMLKFSSPPDYEASTSGGGDADNDNTYHVVVLASDTADDGQTGYHKVTVMVTDVAETGEVSWTVDPDGDGSSPVNVPPAKPIMQFQVGARLMASVDDGDIKGTDKTIDAGLAEVTANPTWRWYRSPSKTSMGTMIDGETSATYDVTTADVGMYLRVAAYYLVMGNVDQETASLTSDYPVLQGPAGNNALKFSPAAVSREVTEGDKGMNVGAPVTATGNHGAVNYTLADDTAGDNEKFKIDQKTGQITTLWDLNRDVTVAATEDVAGNCAIENSCVVTVRATDASGAATAVTGTTVPPVFVDATVTITLTDVNEKPTFSSGPTAITRNENTTALADADAENTVTYTAEDPESRSLTYLLMGPDGAKFQLSATRVLSFKTAPDYEMPGDANRDNVYMVTVRASDGRMHADRMVAVTIDNVDDAPDVSGPSSVNFAENGTGPVGTYTADDPEGATTITWSVAPSATDFAAVEGIATEDAADADYFEISDDGVLTFGIGANDDPPDFEAPRGTGPITTDNTNTYRVVVAAADAVDVGETGYYKVTVMVTNVAEPGKVTWTTAADGNGTVDDPTLIQFDVGTDLGASATDGDVAGINKAVTNPAWRWYRAGRLINGQEANTYEVTTADVGSRLRVEVTYDRVGGVGRDTVSLTSDHPVLADRPGDNELEFDPTAVSREVSEGDKGMNVGTPVTATGNHGAVNYTLAGTDETKFEIDGKTGQITTMVDLDYEADSGTAENCTTQNECSVTVAATDASGDAAAAPAAVTIEIKNVEEKPTFLTDTSGTPPAGSPTTITVPEDSTDLFGADTEGYSVSANTGVTYAAMDPEELNVNLTLMGRDEAKFSLSSDGVLSFGMKPDYEMPTDANKDNVYEVTVRASDGTLHEDRMVKVTVINVDEAPEIIQGGLFVSGPGSASHPENGTDAVGEYKATGPMKDSARWSLEGDDASYFRLGTARGAMTELSFRSAPNYEMPRGMAMSDTNTNTYMVTLKADDGKYTDTHEVTVTVTNVTEIGTLAGMESISYPENGTDAVDTYATSGPATATWSLDGDDAGDFNISAGALSFRTSPNFESPADADTNNTYMVTVKAMAGGEMDMMDVTVTVTNVEELGTLEGEESIPYAENGTDAVDTYATSGPAIAMWSLDGDDAGDFNISAGALSFRTSPNFESPADADTNNTYMVTVKAMAGGEMDMMDVTVTVTNVEELGTLEGEESIPYAENGTDAVDTYATSGPAIAMWSLDGDDAGDFNISAGALSFRTSPNFESPADADTNNAYMVTVKAMAGGEMDMMDVTVTVTNMEEDGMVTFWRDGADATTAAIVVGDELTAAAMDPDGNQGDAFPIAADTVITSVNWQWAKHAMPTGGSMPADDSTGWMDIGTNAAYTVVAADEDHYLRAMAMYADGEGMGKTAMAMTASAVATNVAPMFSDDTATREVAENTAAGMNIGDPVAAMDADGDTLAYTLGGADMASFDIGGATGQLMTKAALDYETMMSYMVTVTATDPDGESDTIDVTINVTDVDEQQTLMERYDDDKSGRIDKGELADAILDYEINETISKADLAQLILNYETGS